MPHDWINIDKDGTRGWYRCRRCGDRHWIHQEPDAPLVPPSPDLKLSYPLLTCDQLAKAKAGTMLRKIGNLLHKHDALTPEIVQLIAQNLPGIDTSSPYEKASAATA